MPKAAVADVSTPEALRALVNKRFPGAVMMGDDPSLEISRLSTGVLSVDWGIGGGFCRDRHSEIFGPPGTGKTTLTYYLIAETQRNGGRCAFYDVEDKYDAVWAAQCGVNIAELDMQYQNVDGNQVIDVMEMMLRSNLYDLIVLDSIAALLPKEDREQSMTDGGGYGMQQAKMMSKAMRKLTAANTKTACVYINQVREDVGGSAFFKKDVTSGGRAMGHYAALRINMVRSETIKKKKPVVQASGKTETKEVPVGHRVLMRVQKEQTGGAFEGDTTTFVIDYELECIDRIEDLIYLGLQYGLVQGSESRWQVVGYEDEKCATRLKFKAWLRSNRAVAQELEENIINYGDGDE